MNTVALAVVVNSLYCGFMIFVQQKSFEAGQIQERGSMIPGTKQKFLWLQDFHTQSWADWFFLPGIAVAFCHLLLEKQVISGWNGLIMVVIAVTSAIFFWKVICGGTDHKDDWGYIIRKKGQKPEITWGGLSHLPYFGAYCAMGLICLWHVYTGELRGLPMMAGIIGGLAIGIAAVFDFKDGNFDPANPKD